jgi:hypothetical protein
MAAAYAEGGRVHLDDATGAVHTPFAGWVLAVHVAADGDRLVACPGAGGGPVLWVEGGGQWFAYDRAFRGGVCPALFRDGRIVTAPGPGLPAEIRVWDRPTKPVVWWDAYPGFVGGASVAVLSTPDGEEIVTAPLAGGGPHVRRWTPAGGIVGGFSAAAEDDRAGVRVACGGGLIGCLIGTRRFKAFTPTGTAVADVALHTDFTSVGWGTLVQKPGLEGFLLGGSGRLAEVDLPFGVCLYETDLPGGAVTAGTRRNPPPATPVRAFEPPPTRFTALTPVSAARPTGWPNTPRVSPVPMGWSGGPYGGQTGTLGFAAVTRTGGFPVVVGNNHVLAGLGRQPVGALIVSPGRDDHGIRGDALGGLGGYVPIRFQPDAEINQVDAAYVTVAPSTVRPELGYRDPAGNTLYAPVAGLGPPPERGAVCYKVGRSTGLTKLVFEQVLSVLVAYPPVEPAEAAFADQYLLTSAAPGFPPVNPGDSGSPLLDDHRRLVGLVFAQAPRGYLVANPIDRVLEALDLVLPG